MFTRTCFLQECTKCWGQETQNAICPLKTVLIQPRSHNAGKICKRRFLSAHTTLKIFKHRSAMRTHGTDRRNKAAFSSFSSEGQMGALVTQIMIQQMSTATCPPQINLIKKCFYKSKYISWQSGQAKNSVKTFFSPMKSCTSRPLT